MDKGYKIIRVITVAPLLALAMVLIIAYPFSVNGRRSGSVD